MTDPALHFGLSHDPFGAHAQPIESPAVARALAELMARLQNGAQLAVVEGASGSGRTTLLRRAATALAERGLDVHAPSHLTDVNPDTPATVLLIDEADLLPVPARDRLMERADGPGQDTVVLALRPGGGAALPTPVQPVRIAPLTHAEAQSFLADHLTRAGARPDLFTPKATTSLIAAAEGSPRRLRRLAGMALVEAAVDGVPQIDAEHASGAVARQQVGPAATVAPVPRATVAPVVVSSVQSAARQRPPSIDDSAVRQSPRAAPPPPPRSPRRSIAGRPLLLLGLLVPAAFALFIARPLLDREQPAASTTKIATSRVQPRTPGPRDTPADTPSPGAERAAVEVSEPDARDPYRTVEQAPAEPEPEPALAEARIPSPPDPVRTAPAEPTPARAAAAPPRPAPGPPRDQDAAETAALNRAELEPLQPAPRASDRPRVFVHYAPYDASAANDVAHALRARGWRVVALRPVSGRVSQASARYFRPADAAAARELAIDLGDELDERAEVRDFTRYPRPPAPGTLEVWLPTDLGG